MRKASLVLLCGTLLASVASADVVLPPLISDGMVLQSGIAVPLWGKASPGEQVTASFAGQKKQTTADASGHWRLSLDPLTATAAGELVVQGKNRLTVKDVLVGEVWLASGQSNMGYYVAGLSPEQLSGVKPSDQIRVFKVDPEATPQPAEQVRGRWVKAAPQLPAYYSAVACLFAAGLHEQIKTPVGIIQSSWGGTCVHTWMSMEALESRPEFAARLQKTKAMDNGVLSVADHKARVEAAKANPQLKKPIEPCELPARLYNGMIRPLAPYALRGVIWYQGESDAYQPQDYRLMFPAMIQDWRKTWGQERLPFLFVQLPNYMTPVAQQPMRTWWAEQREAQTAALSLPDVGMIVTIDLGEADIHPRNKKDVAARLVRLALAQVYGKDVPYKAPSYASMTVEGQQIRIRFKDARLGLKSRDGQPLKSFAIAGADKKFAWADARIDGDSIVVSAAQVAHPVAVRYAWQENPPTNLVSRDDLPVAPFRTDDWR